MALINITNGTPNDADEVMTNFNVLISSNLKMELMDYASDTKYKQSLSSVIVYYDGTSTGSSGGTNLFYDAFYEVSGTNKIYGIVAYDLCNNSAVDATLWTDTATGGTTVTEDTEKIILRQSAPSGAGSGLLTTNDLSNSKAADFRIMFRAQVSSSYVSSSPAVLRLTDGTNTKELQHHNSASDQGVSYIESIYEIRYDSTADTIDIYINGVIDTSDYDVSSWSSIKIQGSVTGGSSATSYSSRVYIYGLFCDSISGTPTYVSQEAETDVDNFQNAAIYVKTETLSNGSSAYYLSADGTNYETVTKSNRYGAVGFTNVGKYKQVKLELTASGSLSDDVPTITAYYAIWDDS
jgi:hypothetical protein